LSGPRPPFSVVVPTLNEAREIEETLCRAREAFGPAAELIVVDGGSSDGTPALAARYATVRSAPLPSRGGQLHLGASIASGRILVFLHADTWLSPDAGLRIQAAVDANAAAGCLRFALRGPRRARYRLLERGVNWRTRTFRTATGDQAIFSTREAYSDCGGIEPIPIFEDVRFVRAVRRMGPFVPVGATAFTSARRWEREGVAKTVARHVILRGLHALGVAPTRLAARYR